MNTSKRNGPPTLGYVERQLNLEDQLKRKSCFLFGPRQTGKSSLIDHTLKDARVFNLLDNRLFLELNQNPGLISERLDAKDKLVVIDEIQRLPILLNEVHLLIEKKKMRFFLTGSSARSLRRKGVNLLGGRANTKYLHPFTCSELGSRFVLNRALSHGSIPSIYFSSAPQEDLESYCGDYLQQEVISEGLARNIPSFTRFLKVAALCNASVVNFTNLANDAQVKRTTIYEYFEVLKDTLILHELPAFKKGLKRKPICSSKFYFFDNGVARTLQGRGPYVQGTSEYGFAFETFIMQELTAFNDYKKSIQLSFWQSKSGYEVDFVINDHTAVEVKAKKAVNPDDLRSLKAIAQEHRFKRLICVSLEESIRKAGDIEILPWQVFLEMVWSGGLGSI